MYRNFCLVYILIYFRSRDIEFKKKKEIFVEASKILYSKHRRLSAKNNIQFCNKNSVHVFI